MADQVKKSFLAQDPQVRTLWELTDKHAREFYKKFKRVNEKQ